MGELVFLPTEVWERDETIARLGPYHDSMADPVDPAFSPDEVKERRRASVLERW